MDCPDIARLAPEEQKLLCYCAYMGVEMGAKELEAYAQHVARMPPKKLSQLQERLQQALFLQRGYSWSWRGYFSRISPEHYFPVLHFLHTEHPEWCEEFAKINSKRPKMFTLMEQCLEKMLRGNKIVPLESFEKEMTVYFCAAVWHPRLVSLTGFIPDGYLLNFFERTFVKMNEGDIVDREDVLPQLLKSRSETYPDYNTTVEALALYRYFSHGEYKPNAKPAGVYGFLLEGIRALHMGRYTESLALLTQALKLRNRNADIKNVFSTFLNNFYLMMAYVHEGSTTSQQKLKQFLHKKDIELNIAFLPSIIVADFFVSKQDAVPDYHVNGLKRYLTLPSQRAYGLMWYLFIHYFGLADKEGELPLADFIPNQLVLRHELSAYLPLSDEERKQLEQLYGTKPALTSLRRQEKWELMLSELLEEEKKTDRGADPDHRIAYFIRYGSLVEVREQSRLKSGAWGSGKVATRVRFANGEVEGMNEVDRLIAGKLSYRWEGLTVADVLPHLIGSDRVYTGTYAPFTQVTVSEEKPYLLIDKNKNGFDISSNVSLLELADCGQAIINKRSETHYVVIPLTPRQKKHYETLLGIGKMPMEAENLLSRLLAQAADELNIHSSVLGGENPIETLDSESILCIQLKPQRNRVFRLILYIKVLDEGKEMLQPGKGKSVVIDEKGGTMYRVKRQLTKERDRYNDVVDFLSTLPSVVSEGEFGFELTPQSVLELLNYVQQAGEGYAVEWPEGEALRLKSPTEGSWNVSLRSAGGWFEMEGDVQVDEKQRIAIGRLLAELGNSRGRFVRLNETDYLCLSDRIRKQLDKWEALTVEEHGKARISPFQANLIGEALSGAINVKHDDEWEKLSERIARSYRMKPEVPPRLKATLCDYQTDGYCWMKRLTAWGGGACLADDMGLGKTVQAIAFLLSVAADGASLVVAPLSVLPNWKRELQRFAPDLEVVVLNEAADRKAAITQAEPYQIVLTTYGLLPSEVESLASKEWNTVCLDEAHTIKNRDTKMSKAAMQLRMKHRIILTGTPIQNHLGELWNLFHFLNPGLLGSYNQFHQKYITPIEQNADSERQRQLKHIILPFILRRTKSEVVEELPDKTEIILSVPLSKREMALYEHLRHEAEQHLQAEHKVSVSILSEITRLRQAACAPQLVEKEFPERSSKIEQFMTLAGEIMEGGNRALVFSQFTSFLALVRQRLDEAAVPYLYFDGSHTSKQREEMVRKFRTGEVPFFLISLKAGGLGLNLVEANYVIHLDPWWNPAIEQQATDRAYRIGQQQKVTVYHLISQGTIEEKIMRLHGSKRNLADSLLEGVNTSHRITEQELLEMLSE